MTEFAKSYGALPGRLDAPSVRRMSRVAEQLGDALRGQVVFIGASLLPLMETEENVLSESRATDDVDAVTATSSYGRKFDFEQALRARGFRNDVRDGTHLDRWRSPDGVTFDCVSCGAHVGGTANADDLWTIEQAVETDLPPLVRHASAVGLLLLKSAAYRDRGATSPITSKDLSDIATLLATRPILPDEVSAAELTAKKRLADSCRSLVKNPRVVAAIRSHIAAREPLFDGVDDLVLERTKRIASA